MSIRFTLQEYFLNAFAEWEFRLGITGLGRHKQQWRQRHLRLMRVVHGNAIACGLSIYIRNQGNLTVGERCALGSFAKIWNYAPILIGEDFMSAGGLTVNSATHDPTTLAPVGKPIRIGNRVWCGLNVTILAGVTIGNDVVIGAGSVVTSDIPSNCIAAGVPAKYLKDLVRDPLIPLCRPFTPNN